MVTCLQSNPIGTNFAGFCLNLKQFYWYKQRGLLFKLRRPLAFYWVYIDWLAPRHPVGVAGGEIPPFHGNQNPSPGCLPAPAPAAPHYLCDNFHSYRPHSHKAPTTELLGLVWVTDSFQDPSRRGPPSIITQLLTDHAAPGKDNTEFFFPSDNMLFTNTCI